MTDVEGSAVTSSETEPKTTDSKIQDEGKDQGKEARTFIRVKRKISDDPAAQLIISYKRQRIDLLRDQKGQQEVEFETINSVLEFAGTHQPHESVRRFVSNFVKTGAQLQSVKAEGGIKAEETAEARRESAQREARRKSAKGRYKVVSAKRGLDDSVEGEGEAKQEDENVNYLFHCFDLVEPEDDQTKKNNDEAKQVPQEDVITCNGQPMVVERKAPETGHDYVYDVYTLKSPLQHVEDLHVDVEHLWEPELVPETAESDEEGARDEADTDSNDENNPNNSYPEEDSDFTDENDPDEHEYYASYEQPEYEPDDEEEAYFAEEKHHNSAAMKALAKHLKTVQLETGGGLKGNEFSSSDSDDDDDRDLDDSDDEMEGI